jgi:hypothetical protein
MDSFTNLKTIDEIMNIVDGNKSGCGFGLGYKPYYMSGNGFFNDINYKNKELKPIIKKQIKIKK